MFKKYLSFSNLTLLVALSLSTVAAYYSIIGLTAIFAGAVIPIIIMGSILEIGKITTTVWLRKYWTRCSWILKLYLIPAVILLAVLTSMGIFGFLSKAHMDQGIISGDSQAKLALYDEKIKTQRDNIDIARKALQQMDAQVDARLSRGESEQGAERAVQIRRQQQGERAKLQKEISEAQKEIAKLNEERAPIAAETRKIEAEVGPVKYIAALIYGDNADQNMLEAAVRWVIILLVIVFDPLAIALVLAANASKEWDKEEEENKPDAWVADVGEKPTPDEIADYEQDDGPLNDDQIAQIRESVTEHVTEPTPKVDPHPVGWMYSTVERVKEKVKKPRKKKVKIETSVESIEATPVSPERPGDYIENKIEEPKHETIHRSEGGYVDYKGQSMHENVLRGMHPELFATSKDTKNGFGASFPLIAEMGDIFIRTDSLPNKVFKFNGRKWIEINKETTESYLSNEEYVAFLVNKLSSGEYDIELLTDAEQDAIKQYLS